MIWRKALLLALPGVLLTGASPIVTGAAAAGSAVTEVRTIGTSVQGRNIVAWRIGDPKSTRKVVVLAAMHGNERGPSRILHNLRDGRAIKGADIWVVPNYNPDGVARRTRQNARGVDLNRNYPRNWKRLTGAYDSGPRPASEPETKAVMAFLQAVRPAYVVSFHQPLRGVGRAGPKGKTFVRRLHRGLRLPVKSFNCSGACHGTMTEWFNASFPGVAVTVEYGRGVSRKQATRTGPNGVLRAVGARR
jgi:predicted deacylase